MSGRLRAYVVIFVKMPRLGQVKSRLAAGIGALSALRFYRETTTRVLRVLGHDPRWRTVIATTPAGARRGRFWDRALSRFDQGSGDLGRRMARAFRALPPGPAVIVGSDIPALAPRHIRAAFHALGNHDAVIGPARDGGYWLIGLKRSRPLPARLFAQVRWSSPHALADTRATLPRSYRVALLETLEDVDDRESHDRWRAAETLKTRRRVSSDAPAGGA
ncbi:MAG TPA: TIGR04282 family arsenosugar biosynthesis glycosyltransferase [Stellaceae bacterium]|nr:TIGR04282 family arsenosugar biosynthesis glycosyltransferase [Stellaceae bacterium]